MQDVHDHPQRGRLARAVGSDKAVNGTARDGDREVVDRGVGAEGFRDAADRHGGSVGLLHSNTRLTRCQILLLRSASR